MQTYGKWLFWLEFVFLQSAWISEFGLQLNKEIGIYLLMFTVFQEKRKREILYINSVSHLA